MKRINWLIIIVLFGAFGSVAAGGDVSGKWVGVFHVTAPDGSKRDDKAVVILQQQGNEVTGSLGETEEKQFPFKKGKMNGNVLTIEMDRNPVVFTLKLEANKLTGEIRDAEDTSKVLGQVDLTRK